MVFATWFGAETLLGIAAIFLDDNLGGMIFRSLRSGARADPVLPVFLPSAVPHEADHLFGGKWSVALTTLVHMTVTVTVAGRYVIAKQIRAAAGMEGDHHLRRRFADHGVRRSCGKGVPVRSRLLLGPS